MLQVPAKRVAAGTTTGSDSSLEITPLEEIRSQFPALARKEGGQPVAYFDGPGGTQVPRCVADAMVDYLYHHNANTHWNYPTSHETDAIIDHARRVVADFVGGRPEEIIFGANSTTLVFHLSRALGPQLLAGDEIVITELDHHANIAPWQALARERGCVLKTVRIDLKTFALDWQDFERQLGPRTKLVAVGAASNALGTVTDIGRACRLAKSVGALAFVDAVHYAPHFLADVAGWGCDFLMCSAYKFYGPHIGMLWCRRQLLESLPFVKVAPAANTAPSRAETGTQSHESIAGAAAAVEFLVSLAGGASRRERLASALAGLHRRSLSLVEQLWSGLSAIGGVTLYGPQPDVPRTPTVAFTVRGVKPIEVAGELAKRGVFVSHGDFYAATAVERLGLQPDGVVRAGCACYTSADETARLIDGVRQIAKSRLS